MATRSSKSAPADLAPLAGAGLGRVAYEAYVAAVGGKSIRGEKLPSWDSQVEENHDVAAAWCAAGRAARSASFSKES